MTKGPKDPSRRPAIGELGATTGTSLTQASSGVRALADLIESLQGTFCPHRRYVLERVDSELVFRQPEIDAILEAAFDEVIGTHPQAASHRRTIKLPS